VIRTLARRRGEVELEIRGERGVAFLQAAANGLFNDVLGNERRRAS